MFFREEAWSVFPILYMCVFVLLLIYLVESGVNIRLFSAKQYIFMPFFLPPFVIKIATMPEQDSDRSVLLRVDGIWNRDVSLLCLNKASALSFHMIVNSFNCHTY